MKHTRFILLIVSLFIVLSCSQRPSNVLSKEEMMDVLYDLQLAQAIHDDYNIELSKTKDGKEAVMNSVLLKHNLNRADLDSSVLWYSDNLGEYKVINDSVSARLRRQVNVLRAEDEALRGVNVIENNNTIPFCFYLDRANAKRTFLLRESDMADKGGLKNFRLSFKVLGLNKDLDRNIETGVYFLYGDTTVVTKMMLKKDSSYVIQKPNMPDSLLTQIQGFFRLSRTRTFMPMKIYDVKYTQEAIEEEGVVETSRLDTLTLKEIKPKSAE